MRWLKLFFAIAFLCAAGLSMVACGGGPDIRDLDVELAPSTMKFGARKNIAVTFYGTSTLLFDDGETQILIDGFFTRPSLAEIAFTPIGPDHKLPEAIEKSEDFTRLKAIAVAHSHHDHVLDTGVIANLTNATVLGSKTTGLTTECSMSDQGRFLNVDDQEVPSFGKFSVKFIPTRHGHSNSLMHWLTGIGKDRKSPLCPPARIWNYKEGGSYAILITHQENRFLVQASAGFLPGALNDVKPQVVFLGIAGLGGYDPDEARDYLTQTVPHPSGTIIVPVHWDRFTRPAGPQTPHPAIDDVETGLQRVKDILVSQGARLVVMEPKRIDWERDN